MLRDHPDEITRVCALTPFARQEYGGAADNPTLDEVERARLFWARITMSFNAVPGSSCWRLSTRQHADVVSTQLTQLGRFAAAAVRLRQVAIHNRPAVDLIREVGRQDDALVYCDPPYVHSTRTDGGSRYTAYVHEMTNDCHRELAEALHGHPGIVVMSGYQCDLYDDLYGSWWSTSSTRRKWSSTNTEATVSTEMLWSNCDLTRQPRLAGIA